jgi:hypothetical protein
MPSWKKVILSGSDALLNSVSASSFVYSEGDVIAQEYLRSFNSVGDEGGEVFLNKPATNTSITGGITLDVYQNRFRIFEQGGPARGGYLDITTLGGGVTTNLAFPDSASYALTASFAQNFNPLATASYASQALSSSYSLTATSASHALNANNAITASYVATASYTPTLDQVTDQGSTTTNSITAASFTGSLFGTASYASQALTSSYSLTATSSSHALNADNAISSSHAIFADTASFLPASTNLNIASISASNAVFQSASIGYLQTVTGSAIIIGQEFIILNTDTPAARYAGMVVIDSGSVGVTASLVYDSVSNDWKFFHEDAGTSDYSNVIFGPLGTDPANTPELPANYIVKADSDGHGHHITSSNLYDDGSRVSSAVSLTVTGSITGSDVQINSWGSISASLAAISTTGSSQTLQQVTTNGNITNTSIILTGSAANSLQIVNSGGDIPFISVSGSVNGPTPGRLVDVIYNAISVNANSTTTIAQLPAPKVAGFTFDYIAYVSGNVLQAGRAGVVKGILRNTETGVVTKAFQINETTTLDLEDDGFGTAGLQFTIVQDTNGTSNQLVAITNNNWPYTINYTLTIYYNPDFS